MKTLGITVPSGECLGADTVLKGSVRAPEGFSEGKPEASKPRGRSPQGFAAEGLPKENPGFSTVAQTTKIMRFTGE